MNNFENSFRTERSKAKLSDDKDSLLEGLQTEKAFEDLTDDEKVERVLKEKMEKAKNSAATNAKQHSAYRAVKDLNIEEKLKLGSLSGHYKNKDKEVGNLQKSIEELSTNIEMNLKQES